MKLRERVIDMKKTLLVAAVILLIAAVLCIAAGMFFRWTYGSVMDGSAALYARLLRRSRIFLGSGLALALASAALFAVRHFRY